MRIDSIIPTPKRFLFSVCVCVHGGRLEKGRHSHEGKLSGCFIVLLLAGLLAFTVQTFQNKKWDSAPGQLNVLLG